ncbi:MAG: glycosyl transferase [Acidimicrobiales bacterium]|nr:glycosyl transferase [Acidimicrobiales bacterium]
MTSLAWPAAALSLFVTAAAAPLVVWLLRRREVLDYPNLRSSHDVPTPRGGGLAPMLGLLVALPFAAAESSSACVALAVATIGLGLLGLTEDVHGLPVATRLLLQLVIAAAAAPWLLGNLSGPVAWQVVFAAGVAAWLVAYVNAFNFMDGINGISSMQAIVSGATWWLLGELRDAPSVAVAGAVLAAAGLGFLPVNFPRARVFMGDVGSYALGAWSAVVLVMALRGDIPPVAAVAPVAVYLADTSTTLVGRARRRERWREPHRDHAYQRLVRVGWSHAQVTALVTASAAVASGGGLLALLGPGGAVAGVVIAGLAVATYLAAPIVVTRLRPAGHGGGRVARDEARRRRRP